MFQGADLTVCPDGKFAANEACAKKASFTNVPRPNQKQQALAMPALSLHSNHNTAKRKIMRFLLFRPGFFRPRPQPLNIFAMRPNNTSTYAQGQHPGPRFVIKKQQGWQQRTEHQRTC